jgi:hypothetical protein
MKRFLSYFEDLLDTYQPETVRISEELEQFFKAITRGLQQHKETLSGSISDTVRKDIVDALGNAASQYRSRIYTGGFSGVKKEVSTTDLREFVAVMSAYADHAIGANQRPDKLYHSYNLMTVTGADTIAISHLSEMLEGQVAVLSSGSLSPEQALEVLDALRQSALYREDQNSYILYPDKDLPRFVDKNRIPEDLIKKSSLLLKLLEDGNRQIVEQDVKGNYHFNGDFNNSGSLKKALTELPPQYEDMVAREREEILDIFEAVFDHKSFTGRSGTFFGYEGLGSIYWHMVSKLSVAAQECCFQGLNSRADANTRQGLIAHYHQINEGIGVHKPPQVYGAFPTDPYSHTPAHRGAQQPGMTGQVKEDILVRQGELGVRVLEGHLHFGPGLLRKDEFLTTPQNFEYRDVHNALQSLEVPESSLAFTVCQVPIVYTLGGEQGVEVRFSDGSSKAWETYALEPSVSSLLFERTGTIESIRVRLDTADFK